MNSIIFLFTDIAWLVGHLRPSEDPVSLGGTTLICAALAWLFYRAWLVLRIPLPQLIDLLGLELPRTPDVSLAGIDAETITLHWNRPEDGSSVVKYLIQVNGIIVGESAISETAITVSGLHPDHYYAVRVIAVNGSNYQNASNVIRLKTRNGTERRSSSASVSSTVVTGSQYGKVMPLALESRGDGPGAHGPSNSTEPNSSSTGMSVTARDRHSASQSGRKAGHGRKGSPISNPAAALTLGSEQLPFGDEQTGSPHSDLTVEQLTERLEAIRQETEESQLQKAKEEEEFQAAKVSMVRERDRLKQVLKEKEDVSAELKREVASLERQNRAAQSNKTAKERLLRQKQDERKKLQQDIERWEREVEGYRKDIDKMKRQKRKIMDNSEKEAQAVRERIGQWQSSIKEMEEDIRLKGAQIKELEEKRRREQVEADESEAKDQERRVREEEMKWEAKLRDLQAVYTKTLHSVQQAQEQYRQAQERLAWWRSRGVSNPAQSAVLATQELDLHSNASQRTARRNRSTSITRSSPVNGAIGDSRFPTTSATPISPFFTLQTGIDRHPAPDQTSLSKEDVDQLTAGAKMSPRADLLLPSGLLGDEDMLTPRIGSIGANLAANRTSDTSSFPAFGVPALEGFLPETHSPDSIGSRDASLFSSPTSSLQHLPGSHVGPDVPGQSNRMSQSSFDAAFLPLGAPEDADSPTSKRFASLFGWNSSRQRGKTLDLEPPALGDLKPNQSRSYPRNWEQPVGQLDPIGTKRRKGSASTSWINPMANFNFRSRSGNFSPDPAEGEEISGKGGSPRRKGFNMFGSKNTLLNLPGIVTETTSPRPSSVSSGENALPRPSTESQPFGWPVQRGGRAGPDWSMPSGDPWSRGPSRRGSVQYGSTSSLSLGITAVDADLGAALLSRQTSSPQPPIGTRPQSASKGEALRLNPAAPSFKTIFGRKEARKFEKAEKQERAAELEREKERERERDREFEMINEEASSANRTSRDSRSVHTEESLTDSRNSLDRSESATASDSAGGGGAGTGTGTGVGLAIKDKESIFQRISRKHSSSKFNVPWKDKSMRGSGSSNRKTTSTVEPAPAPAPSSGDVDDEGSTESQSQLGRSVDSVTSSPSMSGSAPKSNSLSWSSLRRKGKKGERPPVETSTVVLTDKSSERGDHDDDGAA